LGDELRYRGVVEWGFKAPDVLDLLRCAKTLVRRGAPFADLPTARDVMWLDPRVLAEVSYAEISAGCYGLRRGGLC
jgi:ATP-dependent DNA ligase